MSGERLVERLKRILRTHRITVSLTLGGRCSSWPSIVTASVRGIRAATIRTKMSTPAKSRCRDNAGEDDGYMSRAERCHDGIGDKIGAAATFELRGRVRRDGSSNFTDQVENGGVT